jgi:hypothetical protein
MFADIAADRCEIRLPAPPGENLAGVSIASQAYAGVAGANGQRNKFLRDILCCQQLLRAA